ncbi:MAG: ABC transporter substrate-binding protein, partial [Spirochaetia bacterium]
MTGSRRLAMACSLLSILVACSPRSEPTPQREVRVQLGWTHQAQWAGFYAAEKNGYYSAESLSVSLIPRTDPTVNTLTGVADGTAQFGTTNGVAAVSARSRGVPILPIAAIYRRNPQVFMTLSGSGISSPQDFEGRTIRNMNPAGNEIIFNAM